MAAVPTPSLQLRARAELELRRRGLRQQRLPFAEYHDRPAEFCEEVLGLRLWSRQRQLIGTPVTHRAIAVRAGHKVSKSTSFAALALWFANTRVGGRVVMTAPGNRQIKDILWRELRRLALPRAHILGAVPALLPSTGMRWRDGREILGFQSNETERIAGISGEQLMFLVDEANGVSDDIFEAIEGNRAGGAHLLLSGNPTRQEGEFFRSFHDPHSIYRTLHISSEESPNVTGAEPPIPGLATREWVDEKLRVWGRDDPRYQVRVLGNFPERSENAVIALALIADAIDRWSFAVPGGPLAVGIDVARFGDDVTVIQPVRGLYAFKPLELRHADGPTIAAKAMQVIRAMREPTDEGRVAVKVDGNGVGASAVDALKAYADEVLVHDVNVGKASDEPQKYTNLRAQLHFGVGEWLEAGGAIPPTEELRQDLLAPRYGFDAQGRLVVESKDEIRKRLKRSPDHGEALQLAVYHPAHVPQVLLPDVSTYRFAATSRGF